MKNSKAAVIVSSILSKILGFVGYVVGAFFLIGLIIGLTGQGVSSEDRTSVLIVSVVFVVISTFLVLWGRSIKKRIQRFKTYIGIISTGHITSIDQIAASTSQSVDFVKKDLQKMIDKNYFLNAAIDLQKNELIIGGNMNSSALGKEPLAVNHSQAVSVQCPGCGATNVKPQGSAVYCEYCGSLLK